LTRPPGSGGDVDTGNVMSDLAAMSPWTQIEAERAFKRAAR